MLMKISVVMSFATFLTVGSAWMTSPAARTETRLMGTRRNFFGGIVASSATIVAGPWIAYANEEGLVADGPVEDQSQKELVLVGEGSAEESFERAEPPPAVEVGATESFEERDSQDVMEISNTEEQEELTMALDAKIQESIESVDAVTTVASDPEGSVEEAELTLVAMVDKDKTKMFQELFDERKAVNSDADMDAFRTKLQARIAADASFVEEFESFLDELTLASV